MTLQVEIETATAKIKSDAETMHKIVHGQPTDVVQTEGGLVPSVANAIAALRSEFESDPVVQRMESAAVAAEAQAAAAGTSRTGADASRDQAALSAAAALAAAQSIGEEKVEIVTANRTAVLADNGHVWAVDASAGAVTVTLPLIETVGEPYRLRVKKTDATANKVTIRAQTPDTLDGKSSGAVAVVQSGALFGAGDVTKTGTGTGLELSNQHDGAQLSSDLDPDPNNWVSQRFGVTVGDTTPIGVVDYFSGRTPPPGYLVLDGGLYSRTVYAALWEFIQQSGRLVSEAGWQSGLQYRGMFSSGDGSTNFRLPDAITDRMFFRAQSGADADFGQRKEDAIQGHYHSLTGYQRNGGYGTSNIVEGGVGSSIIAATGFAIGAISDGTNGTPRLADETRPKSIGVLPCIKAFSVPVDPKSLDITVLAAQVSALSVQKYARAYLNAQVALNGSWLNFGNSFVVQAGGTIDVTIDSGGVHLPPGVWWLDAYIHTNASAFAANYTIGAQLIVGGSSKCITHTTGLTGRPSSSALGCTAVITNSVTQTVTLAAYIFNASSSVSNALLTGDYYTYIDIRGL